jgi:AcrR family transcriptional regulator
VSAPERVHTRRPAGGTERAFIEVATELFAERGYLGTSISDIAKELGLTTASLYYHIPNKQDLLFRVLKAGMVDFLVSIQEINASADTAASKLRRATTSHVDFVLAQPAPLKVFLRERRFLPDSLRREYSERINTYDRIFSGILKQAMDEGSVPVGDPSLLRVNALGMINWSVEWYTPGGRLSLLQVRDALVDTALHNIFGLEREA